MIQRRTSTRPTSQKEAARKNESSPASIRTQAANVSTTKRDSTTKLSPALQKQKPVSHGGKGGHEGSHATTVSPRASSPATVTLAAKPVNTTAGAAKSHSVSLPSSTSKRRAAECSSGRMAPSPRSSSITPPVQGVSPPVSHAIPLGSSKFSPNLPQLNNSNPRVPRGSGEAEVRQPPATAVSCPVVPQSATKPPVSRSTESAPIMSTWDAPPCRITTTASTATQASFDGGIEFAMPMLSIKKGRVSVKDAPPHPAAPRTASTQQPLGRYSTAPPPPPPFHQQRGSGAGLQNKAVEASAADQGPTARRSSGGEPVAQVSSPAEMSSFICHKEPSTGGMHNTRASLLSGSVSPTDNSSFSCRTGVKPVASRHDGLVSPSFHHIALPTSILQQSTRSSRSIEPSPRYSSLGSSGIRRRSGEKLEDDVGVCDITALVARMSGQATPRDSLTSTGEPYLLFPPSSPIETSNLAEKDDYHLDSPLPHALLATPENAPSLKRHESAQTVVGGDFLCNSLRDDGSAASGLSRNSSAMLSTGSSRGPRDITASVGAVLASMDNAVLTAHLSASRRRQSSVNFLFSPEDEGFFTTAK